MAQEIRVRGLVQGVGFRPAVWHMARDCHLVGEVFNDGEGVLIRAWGHQDNLDEFHHRLRAEAPPLSRIDAIEIAVIDEISSLDDFVISASDAGVVSTGIIPDAATCPACRTEGFDPTDRRYRYAFTNCTHCGPRLSITRAIPYDRAHTAMAVFTMCNDCQQEYDNPADRRFHAQPNACPACGPRVWLADKRGVEISPPVHKDALAQTADLLRQGYIVAIKGLGGFHLACDAGNEEAVRQLRARKSRYDKPFALMARDREMVEKHVIIGDRENQLLHGPQAPIVLMDRRQGGDRLSDQVAPGQACLGFMLPYTPLHHFIMADLDRPLVMTSANISHEPQVTDNRDALQKLGEIADFWLMHDREIVNRLDDSLLMTAAGEIRILRRARGYAPESLMLPPEFRTAPHILAMGGEMKNTFCLLKKGQAVVSQHMGNLKDARAHEDYRKNLTLYQTAHDFTPDHIAVDRHPGYFSSQWGEKLAAEQSCPVDYIQHHHAHIAACMAEYGISPSSEPVVGVALDGMGYGADGSLWGGEFLLADYSDFKRMAHFQPVAMPGGEKAAYEPWRNCFAHIVQACDWPSVMEKYGELDLIKYLRTKPLDQIGIMIERNLNAPGASSAGRLFDGVAAAVGICRNRVNFEGQAAMALQAMAETMPHEGGSYDIEPGRIISWGGLWAGILNDLKNGIMPPVIAARFHNSLAQVITRTVLDISAHEKTETLVLSGGVFQNRLLLQKVVSPLKAAGMQVLIPEKFPANDGGISLGQAVIAAARHMNSPTHP